MYEPLVRRMELQAITRKVVKIWLASRRAMLSESTLCKLLHRA